MQRLDSAQWRWMKNPNPIIKPPLVETFLVFVFHRPVLIWHPKTENTSWNEIHLQGGLFQNDIGKHKTLTLTVTPIQSKWQKKKHREENTFPERLWNEWLIRKIFNMCTFPAIAVYFHHPLTSAEGGKTAERISLNKFLESLSLRGTAAPSANGAENFISVSQNYFSTCCMLTKDFIDYFTFYYM